MFFLGGDRTNSIPDFSIKLTDTALRMLDASLENIINVAILEASNGE